VYDEAAEQWEARAPELICVCHPERGRR